MAPAQSVTNPPAHLNNAAPNRLNVIPTPENFSAITAHFGGLPPLDAIIPPPVRKIIRLRLEPNKSRGNNNARQLGPPNSWNESQYDHDMDNEIEHDGSTRYKYVSFNSEQSGIFRFMDLPPELRLRIYGFVHRSNTDVVLKRKLGKNNHHIAQGYVCGWYGLVKRYPHARHFFPRLLTVSKMIHNEAIIALYKRKFIFENSRALFIFLAKIGSTNRDLVRDVVICTYGHASDDFAAMSLLAECRNLVSLNLKGFEKAPRRDRGEAVNQARELHKSAILFLQRYGTAHGKRDAAVDIFDMQSEAFPNSDPATSVSVFLAELRRQLLAN